VNEEIELRHWKDETIHRAPTQVLGEHVAQCKTPASINTVGYEDSPCDERDDSAETNDNEFGEDQDTQRMAYATLPWANGND